DGLTKTFERFDSRGCYNQPGSVKQCTPNLESGGVECYGCELKEDFVGLKPCVIRPFYQPDDISMGNAYALRVSGRTRRVDNVCEVLGSTHTRQVLTIVQAYFILIAV